MSIETPRSASKEQAPPLDAEQDYVIPDRREAVEKHHQGAGFGNSEYISARLEGTHEPLSAEKSAELVRLSTSDVPDDTLQFVEGIAALTPSQRVELSDYRSKEVAAERGLNDLYDLKFTNPSVFKEQMRQLSSRNAAKFYALESKRDAMAKLDQPDRHVPRLSGDGENWVTPPDLGVRSVEKVQTSRTEMEALNNKANSLDLSDRKEYAKAVQDMPTEKLSAVLKYRQESGKPLDPKYLKTMYAEGNAADPRLRDAFKNEALQWTPAQQQQYMEYAQGEESKKAAEQPKGFRRLLAKIPFLHRKAK